MELDTLADGELQSRGDTARESGNYPVAAYLYRELLKRNSNETDLWLRHGNVLQKLGCFLEARDSFKRASSLSPTDLAPVLQSAVLSKTCGDFLGALKLYTHCLSLEGANANEIQAEINLLRRNLYSHTKIKGEESVLYLSCVSASIPDDNPQQLKSYLGASNYSYGYVMRGYQRTLEKLGFTCRVIQNPEYMPDMRSRSARQAVHIGFYPPDAPRFLKGTYNIICIAWEFERLRSRAEVESYHAFSDAASMLGRADEVWAISEFGAEAVRRAGIPIVHAVSTPVSARSSYGRIARPPVSKILDLVASRLDRVQWVPLAIVPARQSRSSQHAENQKAPLLNRFIEADEDSAPILFLCVFNVHDFRKQIKPLVEAFVRLAQDHSNAYLLLKVSCIDSDKLDINTMMLMEQISDPGEMTAPLVSKRVLMTTDALSRDEMNALNDIAAYYVCTSHAEGQNLPLIEAMGSGVVPISVDHTAMRDYISTDNAIVIPSKLLPLTPRLTIRYGIYGVSSYYVSPQAVYLALSTALLQSEENYASMSTAAVDHVAQHFGGASLKTAIEQSSAVANKASLS